MELSAERASGNTRKLALTGILSAIVIIALVLESIAPTGRLGFYVLAAFVLSVINLECGIVWLGWLCCNQPGGLCSRSRKAQRRTLYRFFGIYTLLKYHRRPSQVWLEILLKFCGSTFLWPPGAWPKHSFLKHLQGWGVPAAGRFSRSCSCFTTGFLPFGLAFILRK